MEDGGGRRRLNWGVGNVDCEDTAPAQTATDAFRAVVNTGTNLIIQFSHVCILRDCTWLALPKGWLTWKKISYELVISLIMYFNIPSISRPFCFLFVFVFSKCTWFYWSCVKDLWWSLIEKIIHIWWIWHDEGILLFVLSIQTKGREQWSIFTQVLFFGAVLPYLGIDIVMGVRVRLCIAAKTRGNMPRSECCENVMMSCNDKRLEKLLSLCLCLEKRCKWSITTVYPCVAR